MFDSCRLRQTCQWIYSAVQISVVNTVIWGVLNFIVYIHIQVRYSDNQKLRAGAYIDQSEYAVEYLIIYITKTKDIWEVLNFIVYIHIQIRYSDNQKFRAATT